MVIYSNIFKKILSDKVVQYLRYLIIATGVGGGP